jgi:hypothetical protein
MLDLEKTLKRMKVTLKSIEQPTTPGHGFTPATRSWRVTLTRERRSEEKPLKLTFILLSPTEPNMTSVVQGLMADVEDCELSLWEFAQQYGKGKTDEPNETMYKHVRRMGARITRFFGESWVKVSNAA